MRHGTQFTDPSSTKVTRTRALPLSAAGSGDTVVEDVAADVVALTVGSETDCRVECTTDDFPLAIVVSLSFAFAETTVLPTTSEACTAVGRTLPVVGRILPAAV
jgi:G:T/U-mismatch repair DNA glycosylase